MAKSISILFINTPYSPTLFGQHPKLVNRVIETHVANCLLFYSSLLSAILLMSMSVDSVGKGAIPELGPIWAEGNVSGFGKYFSYIASFFCLFKIYTRSRSIVPKFRCKNWMQYYDHILYSFHCTAPFSEPIHIKPFNWQKICKFMCWIKLSHP